MSTSLEKQVVVVGGGFAGLWATRAMAGLNVRVTLVDRTNHHLFQPLLYQVATAGLSSTDIAAPLRHILREQANVTVRLAEAVGLDTTARQVRLADGHALPYDALLVASGATHAYFGNDEWAHHAPGLKTLDDAMLMRRRILLAFEQAEAAETDAERAAWLNFAVVGGGPTGVELAGTLSEIARHTLRSEFRHIRPHEDARVVLLEAGPRVLSSFPPSLSDRATVQLERLGVDVQCGVPVAHINADGYELGGRFVAAKTVLWAAGVAASPLGRMLAEAAAQATGGEASDVLDRVGRVKVLPNLAVPGLPGVFVAGDLASVVNGGKAVPGVAPAAKQMGHFVAGEIQAHLSGAAVTPRPAFTYRDYGNLATIGRMAAVVDLPGSVRFSGVLAWWFWLAAHVFFLIGFRNRLSVIINWAWAYATYQRHARIVIGQVHADKTAKATHPTPP